MDSLFAPTMRVEDLVPGVVICAPEHRGAPRTIKSVDVTGLGVVLHYKENHGGRTYPAGTVVILA